MINVDENKLRRQLVGHEKFKNSFKYGSHKNGIGTWEWVTGMGKTYATCLLINKILNKQKGNVLILVPRKVLKKQWEDTIKMLCKEDLDYIQVMTVDYYLYHKLNKQVLFLVADEIHLFYTQPRLNILAQKNCKYKFALGLTGTFKEKNKRHLIAAKYLPVIDKIYEEEAIENGWISDYIEFNVGYNLEENEQELYDDYSLAIKKGLDYFDNELNIKAFDLIVQCISNWDLCVEFAVSKGWSSSNTNNFDINESYNPNKVMKKAIKILDYTRNRKNLLQHSKSKIEISLYFIKKFFNKKRIITFSESTSFADTLYRLTNKELSSLNPLLEDKEYCTLYHSNLETIMVGKKKYGKIRRKKEAIRKLELGEVNIIHTAKALDVGFDVSDMDMAIITSSSSDYNQQTQRGGRVKRKSKRGTVIIINIYARGTKDYNTLKSRQKTLSPKRIYWIEDLDKVGLAYVNKEQDRLTNFINKCL